MKYQSLIASLMRCCVLLLINCAFGNANVYILNKEINLLNRCPVGSLPFVKEVSYDGDGSGLVGWQIQDKDDVLCQNFGGKEQFSFSCSIGELHETLSAKLLSNHPAFEGPFTFIVEHECQKVLYDCQREFGQGWVQIDPRVPYCYYLDLTKRNWEDGFNFCSGELTFGAHMAIADTEEKRKNIYLTLKEFYGNEGLNVPYNNGFWVAGHRYDCKSDWGWMTAMLGKYARYYKVEPQQNDELPFLSIQPDCWNGKEMYLHAFLDDGFKSLVFNDIGIKHNQPTLCMKEIIADPKL